MKAGMTVLSVYKKLIVGVEGETYDGPKFRSNIFISSIYGIYTRFNGPQPAREYTQITTQNAIMYIPKDQVLEFILGIAEANGWSIDVSGIDVNEARIAVVWDIENAGQEYPEDVLSRLGAMSAEQIASMLRIEQCTACKQYASVHRGHDFDPWKNHYDTCGVD